MSTHCGVLPNERLKKGPIYERLECASRFFKKDGFASGFTREGRTLEKDDVLFYQTTKRGQTNEHLKDYLEIFCWPMLPDSTWKKLTIFESSDKERQALGMSSSMTNCWDMVQACAGEITGAEWYIVVSMMRMPDEFPQFIEKLFEGRLKGLNLTQCWLYASFGTTNNMHHFIDIHTFFNVKTEDIIKFNAPFRIKEIIEDGYSGEKNTTIAEKGKSYTSIVGAMSKNEKLSHIGTLTYMGPQTISVTVDSFVKGCLEARTA